MQKIECPWCGERPQSEFTYYRDNEGVPTRRRKKKDDAEFERIFIRTNQIGEHIELWQHSRGCRGWLKFVRHNVTHDIGKIVPADKPLKVSRS